MASYYDYNLDQSLPPPAIGGNEPSTAPYAPPGFETSKPAPISYNTNPYQGSIAPNPWASATPMPGPQGPPSLNVPTGTPAPSATPYDNYAGPSDVLNGPRGNDFGGIATPGLDQNLGNHYVTNPTGGTDIYDNNWTWIGNMPSSAAPPPDDTQLANVPGITTVTPGGPSDLPNQGQLYYDPQSKSWVSKAASAIGGIPGAIGNVARNIGGVIGGIPGAIGRSLPPNTGGWGQPMGYFGVQPPPGIGQFGVNSPAGASFYPGSGTIRFNDPNSTRVGGSVQAPGGFGGVYGQGSAGYIGDYYGRESMDRLLHGGDPSLGFVGTGWRNYPGAAPILPRDQWGGYQGGPVEGSLQRPGGGANAATHGQGPGGIA